MTKAASSNENRISEKTEGDKRDDINRLVFTARGNTVIYDRSVELRCVYFRVLIKSCHSREA